MGPKFARFTLFLWTVVTLGIFAGCSGLFFYPSRKYVLTPDELGLRYREFSLDLSDGSLYGWILPAEGKRRGVLVQIHGNAENISTHIGSVHWLPKFGYEVVLFDYRGYGRSSGSPSIPNIIEDARATIAYALGEADGEVPVIVLGQSLGGAAAIAAVGDSPLKREISALILDSSFSSFRQVFREKGAVFWPLMPISYLLSFTISDEPNLLDAISRIAPKPVLIVHGDADEIVPVKHAQALFEAAKEPKKLWIIPGGGHLTAFSQSEGRERLLRFLEKLSPPRDVS